VVYFTAKWCGPCKSIWSFFLRNIFVLLYPWILEFYEVCFHAFDLLWCCSNVRVSILNWSCSYTWSCVDYLLEVLWSKQEIDLVCDRSTHITSGECFKSGVRGCEISESWFGGGTCPQFDLDLEVHVRNMYIALSLRVMDAWGRFLVGTNF
jgi:hypothetical protein